MAKPSQPRSISIVEDPEYWQALGRFIERFATVESVLFHYVASIAPMSAHIARAFIPGTRTAELIEIIRRVWQADILWQNIEGTNVPASDVHAEQKGELEPVLSQLKTNNTVRNSLIHYASFVTSDKGRVSSNAARALTAENVKEHRATPEILGQMTDDLEKIGHHLASFIVRWKASFDQRASEWPALKNAWRYKPEQENLRPPQPENSNRGKSRGLSGQRKSSQE